MCNYPPPVNPGKYMAFSKSILLLQVAICVVYSLIVPVDDGDPPPVSAGN